jgi:hypothetical protein
VENLMSGKPKVSHDDMYIVSKERLSFGFDSLYFRYESVIKELSFYKEAEAKHNGETCFNRSAWVKAHLEHYYKVLEQLTHAHTEECCDDRMSVKEASYAFQELAKKASEATGGI